MQLTWISKLFSFFQEQENRCRSNRRKKLFATTSNPARMVSELFFRIA